MNKKNILVSGLSIMFLVGLIGFTTSLAGAIWTDKESPSNQPISLASGGVNITVGDLAYQSQPTYLYPGNGSINATANVTNNGTDNQALNITLDSVTGDAALINSVYAQVWVDTTGQNLTTPDNNSYVLTQNDGMLSYTGNVPTLNLNTLPTGIGIIPSGIFTPTSLPFVVRYGLSLDNNAPTTAEHKIININTSATGIQS
jgi:hypothetical protein